MRQLHLAAKWTRLFATCGEIANTADHEFIKQRNISAVLLVSIVHMHAINIFNLEKSGALVILERTKLCEKSCSQFNITNFLELTLNAPRCFDTRPVEKSNFLQVIGMIFWMKLIQHQQEEKSVLSIIYSDSHTTFLLISYK